MPLQRTNLELRIITEQKISTVKGEQYIICCRFETIAIDMNTMLEKPAAQPNG
jgi:hypothetical protein